MAETCIVCLGDIQHVGGATTADSKSPALEADDTPANTTAAPVGGGSELVATLLPCGHFLHDDCLKPWVERANSCPICRAAFNMVELRLAIGGPVQSSYAVQDKRQVAEIDPTLVIEEDILDEQDDHEDPCMVCDSYGDESELLLCDGCNNTTHVFCAGLDSVPAGAWFCYTCQQDPQILAQNFRTTLGRRRRIRRPLREVGWERAWRSIFDRLHFDLDFPFDEEEDESAEERSAAAERREIREWRRRFDVAARQGAATRFRNTANILRNPEPPRAPKPESQEDLRAWSAFERARKLEDGPQEEEERPRSSRGRKRKSRSNSPHEATPPPTERKLKRPRITNRRAQPVAEASSSIGESSSAAVTRITAPAPQRPHQLSPLSNTAANIAANNRTTFLQSLLSEVETHVGPSGSEFDAFDDYDDAGSGIERSPSPQQSPAISPVVSNHPSPRAMTPPPHSPITRPSSPPPLASTVTPIFPPAPEFSPFSPAVDDSVEKARGRPRKQASRHGSNSPDQSPNHSPTRAPMSYEMKQEIQKMVTAALKPHYNRKEIDKDKYTDINRDVSRMLYDKVWDAGGLIDSSARERWQKVAAEEVSQAIRDTTKSSTETQAAVIDPTKSGTDTPTIVSEKAATASQQATTEVSIRPAAVKV